MRIANPLIALVAAAWTIGIAAAHSIDETIVRRVQESGGTASQDAADAKSKEVFERVCTQCHTLEDITSARKTRTEWQETIEKMVGMGASASEEDFATVLAYLVSHFGRVNVNTAKTADLTAVLGVSEPEAEAVVKYRQEHGRFENFEALKKVPGLDVEKLEKKKDAITF